jgi:hypothetical protein
MTRGWYHQSNDDYLDAPHLPSAYYNCTVPLFDNLNVVEQWIWGDAQESVYSCGPKCSLACFQVIAKAMRILNTQHLPFG